MRFALCVFSTAILSAVVLGCAPPAEDQVPRFSLAWSEYPSWSAFGVCDELGIINGDVGEMSPLEEKWGVDIELKEAEYDPCISLYGSGQVDAVCITNMDILSPSLSRPGVAILPTSTSAGADACIVTNDITEVTQLKDKSVRGLELSVSQYCWARNLQLLGEDPADYTFSNMDPGAAALAMQQKQDGFDAIVVWNPFVLDTLEKREDTHVLFDSTKIPNEIIDMVVIAKSSLEKEGGENFAKAIAEAFFQLNERIANAETRDETLIALGEKFSDLGLESMKKVVEQTKFYSTPAEALELFNGQGLKDTMGKVVQFCIDYEIVPEAPAVAYGSATAEAQLSFDPTFIEDLANN